MPKPAAYSADMNGRCLSSAQVPVITGFGILILLLIAVAAIGVTHIRSLSDQLTAIVAERNQKAELAASMMALHDARYQSILLASAVADPFESDEQQMRFSSLAEDFIVLRDRFLALPLDQAELAAWGEVRKELRLVETFAREAFDLIQSGRREQASQLIQSDLKQHQGRMMSQWARMLAMQRDKNMQAVTEANADRDRVKGLTLWLSGLALLVGLGVAFFVIRLSRRLEADLFAERERALVTLHAIGDAVIRFDHEGRIGYLNPVAESLLGLSGHDCADMPATEVLHLFERDSRADITASLLHDAFKGAHFSLPSSACLLSRQGMEYEVEGKCSPVSTPDGAIIGGVLVMSDVTEARELQRKLLWHSDHDALTGLANRHAFEEHLEHSLGSKRAAQLPMSLLLISLDQLRLVSERAGHACSDELLRQLSHLMNSRVRDSDLLARLGHDEFAVLMQSCPDDMAERIAEQIRDTVLGFRLAWEANSYQVGVHIGVVHISHSTTKEECLMAAYAACHAARSLGPGGMVVHQSAANPDSTREMEAGQPGDPPLPVQR